MEKGQGSKLFNVLKNANIRNDTSCRHDNRQGFSVSWLDNDSLNGYDYFSGMTSLVAWEGKLSAVTISGSCYVGPSENQAPVEADTYNLVRLNFRVEVG